MTAFDTPMPDDPASLDLDALDVPQRRELISAYLDGELSADQSRHVTEWLDTNPGALREVEHTRRTWDLLDAYEDEQVPEGFAARVFEATGIERQETQGRVLRMAWYRQPLAAAAALLIAVGAMWAWSPWKTTPSTPTPSTSNLTAVLNEVPTELLDQVDLLVELDDDELDFALYGADDDEEMGG